MKPRLPRLAAVAAVLALGASASFAHDLQYVGDTYQSISQQPAPPANTPVGRAAALGYAVTGPAARVILLDANVRHVGVTQGESVTFRLPEKERQGWEFETLSPPPVEQFTWKFDTAGTPAFDLSAVAPRNFDVGQVEVHVVRGPSSNGI